MRIEKLVVVVPTEDIYIDFDEITDKMFVFPVFETVFIRGDEPSYFTDKDCCITAVVVGTRLLDLDINDLRRRGTKVLAG